MSIHALLYNDAKQAMFTRVESSLLVFRHISGMKRSASELDIIDLTDDRDPTQTAPVVVDTETINLSKGG